jgi:zinc/manganese transport system substrate-binding protein
MTCAVVGMLVSGLVVAGCGLVGGNGQSGRLEEGGPVRVVAAENFYGSLAGQVGGSHVAVTSMLSNPNADPHLFQADARVQLDVARALVVIAKGDGYDQWMSRLLAATPSASRRTLTVADVVPQRGTTPNPHLWYDVPRLPAVVRAIGRTLTRADPAHAAAYRAGTERTVRSLRPLLSAVSNLRRAYTGAPVAYTEPVPGLLLQAAGLRVSTPASFARAVEDGTDPSPQDVASMRALLAQHRVKALLYNSQAATAVTSQLRQLARAHGVPVVPVTETQPAGRSFVGWQLDQVRALTAALGS